MNNSVTDLVGLLVFLAISINIKIMKVINLQLCGLLFEQFTSV